MNAEQLDARAAALDESDPLRRFRGAFHLPKDDEGTPVIYFCGNSLGLQPRQTRDAVLDELDRWAERGVAGHFSEEADWFSYHELVTDGLASLAGARPIEVVAMGSLTANLHLALASFYRPSAGRFRIVIEQGAFPSDRYAVASHARWHGFDPDDAIIEATPSDGATISEASIEELLGQYGDTIALVLLGAVNFKTGQRFDLARVTAAAHRVGAIAGFDLAHAMGNVSLALHDDDVDFAVWCSYKYLNAGPGAVAGLFVHERFAHRPDLPRLAGWWGNDPKTRFELPTRFEPQPGAAGWQVSNAPILSLASLRASLDLFGRAGLDELSAKRERLVAFLLDALRETPELASRVQVLTPSELSRRGCQTSFRVLRDPRRVFDALERAGVVCDFRAPDVVRIAPVPLYNTFEEIAQFVGVLGEALSKPQSTVST